jgi:hypothetical protein
MTVELLKDYISKALNLFGQDAFFTKTKFDWDQDGNMIVVIELSKFVYTTAYDELNISFDEPIRFDSFGGRGSGANFTPYDLALVPDVDITLKFKGDELTTAYIVNDNGELEYIKDALA